jgi:NADP-reducing hydrogenase subunit HndB
LKNTKGEHVNTINSPEDLKLRREEALRKRQLTSHSGNIQIIIGMGTPGVAVGARETMKAILETIESQNLSNIVVRQTGNIGIDSCEPIVQVIVNDQPMVTYGKVTPDAAKHIISEHLLGGHIVEHYVITA